MVKGWGKGGEAELLWQSYGYGSVDHTVASLLPPSLPQCLWQFFLCSLSFPHMSGSVTLLSLQPGAPLCGAPPHTTSIESSSANFEDS